MVAPAAAAAGAAAAGARGAKVAGAVAARNANAGRDAGARRGRPRRPGRAGGAAGPVAPPTSSDDRALRAELRGRDQLDQAAYQAGLAGEPLGDEANDQQRAAWEAGDLERRRERRAGVLAGARAVPAVRGPGLVNDGAGLILGGILYALALNYLQGGAAQARGWIAAKFLNRPYERAAKAGGRRL